MDMDSKRVEKLITKALLKEISEGEQCELDEWLDASEQNRSFMAKHYGLIGTVAHHAWFVIRAVTHQ